jgi:opacity protein-like surface antigen
MPPFLSLKGVKAMSRKSALAAGAIFVFSTGVHAEDGLYASVGGGVSFAQDIDFSDAGQTVTLELDPGFLVGGALGYQWQAFRLEGEFTFLQNDADKLSALGVSVGADGDLSVLSGFANAYFDFDTQTPWTPYVGGGLGVANVSINDLSVVGSLPVDDDDTVFAYQVKAGVGYRLSPTMDITAGYRFLGTDDITIESVDGDGPLIHNVEVGIRYHF